MTTPSIREKIVQKMTENLAPNVLEVVDESHLHAGHSGHRPGGETHFRLRIVSERFIGQNAVARHRMIYALLAQEMQDRVHALAITALTPDEFRS